VSGHELLLAGIYAAFLAACSAALERSAAKIAREAAPRGEEPPWPQSDAVALRRVLGRTLQVLAVFILAVVAVRAAGRRRAPPARGLTVAAIRPVVGR
jgi:hypothetical protein